MSTEKRDIQQILETLAPIERKILPYIKEGFNEIKKKSGLDSSSVLRALEFLKNKGIVELKYEKIKIIDLDVNGILYNRKGLPERALLNVVAEHKSIDLEKAEKESKLSDNEFKAAIGALKSKALINLANGKLLLNAKPDEVARKSLEEQFLANLPKKQQDLNPEEKLAFQNLQKRKKILMLRDKKDVSIKITKLGEEILSQNMSFTESKELIEILTPEMLRKSSWKGKKFRRYDIQSQVPRLFGGKEHFVNQATEYAKKIWLELGFKEMTGSLAVTGFWNFDALFTAQDHPVREMQDTFYIKDIEGKLPEKALVNAVKKSHEGGVDGSKGWQSEWKEQDAKRVLLRTHTTCLSAKTLKKIAENKEFPAKYFALGKCFRNETVDWSHSFEFNQTEGIVVDENASFRQLLGYLLEFFKKMGYEKIRIRPGYFPYTEPSLEIDIFHPERKKWVELGGAGMFRPEVTIPFFSRHVPVLAWGPGFDRILMEFFDIKDLREMYKNNINHLREMKFWRKE